MSQTINQIYIALDYDDTYTKDPEFWLDFIQRAKVRGHIVRVATMRCYWEDDMDPRLKAEIPIDFCCGKAKKKTLAERGLHPDIWIDDRPDWIVGDE